MNTMGEVAAAGVGADAAGELAATALTLARRFAAGATLWCASPQWPWHARHVAVEFVHPVIMGTRALPAVAVDPGDPVGVLRSLARPGDVVLTVGSGDDRRVADVLRRAPAWGLDRVAVGAGPRPPRDRAEHCIWLETIDAPVAAGSGALVACYHLLWELTHVVFEHPGLLAPDPEDAVCVTCRDEARLGEVLATTGAGQLEAVVAGRRETVDGSLVPGAGPGALVLVHAGVALNRLPDDPADPAGAAGPPGPGTASIEEGT